MSISAPVWDKGIFKIGGEFEYLYDERPNSLPPQINVRDKYTPLGKRIPRFTEEEIRELINSASTRPNAPPNRLAELTKDANLKMEQESMEKKIVNMSPMRIFEKTGLTVSEILIDLSRFFSFDGSQKSFLGIFLKGERLLYLGIFMLFMYVLISLIVYTDRSKTKYIYVKPK